MAEPAHGPSYQQLERDLAAARAEVEQWQKEYDLMKHRVITCGVAATHPDPNLTRTGAYASKWDSLQAEQVRALRQRNEALEGLLRESRSLVQWANHPKLLERIDRALNNCPRCGASEAERKVCPNC